MRISRKGDQLVVTKLDRFGRSLEHLMALSKQLQAKQVDLVVLDQGIDTSTAVGRMFVQILGAIAEFEHALMSERTRDGLDAARARGHTGGQKPKLTPRQAKIAQDMYDELGPGWAPQAHRAADRRRVRSTLRSSAAPAERSCSRHAASRCSALTPPAPSASTACAWTPPSSALHSDSR